MNLLLDTHVAIWAISASHRLPPAVRDILLDPNNLVHASVASIWEISIKHSKFGAARMPFGGADAVSRFKQSGFRLLDITPEHAQAIEKITADHRDPFDRMLIAQAISEPLALVTKDTRIAAYSPTFISW
ncbi:MAG: type II toxin-antitoxin system VapC family toxin [Shinella sp.]|nr:type II toxin-antitoxin system VapC family toxin [Shinella sp.]